jgi:hypothetical protein
MLRRPIYFWNPDVPIVHILALTKFLKTAGPNTENSKNLLVLAHLIRDQPFRPNPAQFKAFLRPVRELSAW